MKVPDSIKVSPSIKVNQCSMEIVVAGLDLSERAEPTSKTGSGVVSRVISTQCRVESGASLADISRLPPSESTAV